MSSQLPHLPPEKRQAMRKAVRLEWVTIFFLCTIIAVMAAVMGSSQAMKTAWIEDVLSLIPPISFLVATRYRRRDPTDLHPYGFSRAPMLAFLVASAAVLVLGLYMLYDSGRSLIERHHPTFGHFDLFGHYVWMGWVMIAALVYSMIPAIVLGRMKLPLSEELHEKTLHADADMNKADWTTAAAAALGVLGVGFGLWWADSAAAAFISFNVLRDGVTNVRRAMSALMDQRPTGVTDDEPIGLEEEAEAWLLAREEVEEAAVRLREEGHRFSGEVFVRLVDRSSAVPDVARLLDRLARGVVDLDWRLREIVVMPAADPRERADRSESGESESSGERGEVGGSHADS